MSNSYYDFIIGSIVQSLPHPVNVSINVGTVYENLVPKWYGISKWEVSTTGTGSGSYDAVLEKQRSLQRVCDSLALNVTFEKDYKAYDKYRKDMKGYRTTIREYNLIGKVRADDVSTCLEGIQSYTRKSGYGFFSRIENSNVISDMLEECWNEVVLKIIRQRHGGDIFITDTFVTDRWSYDHGWGKGVLFQKYGLKPLSGANERNGLFLALMNYIQKKINELDSIDRFEWVPMDTFENYLCLDRANSYYLYFGNCGNSSSASEKQLKEWY